MRKLYDNFLKRQLVDEIQRLGQGICEIMVDIPLSFSTINSIEFNNREGLITIHVFEFPDYEINYDFAWYINPKPSITELWHCQVFWIRI